MDPIYGPNRGPSLVTLSIFMIILPTTAIVLRVWSRFISKGQRFWWDDWLAFGSLPFSLAQLALELQWVSEGLGRHESELTLEKLGLGLQYAYAGTLVYAIAICIPKYSAIFFYLRVFTLNSKVFRINVWIAHALVTGQMISGILIFIFQCSPMKKAPTISGRCINNFQWNMATLISSVIIDVYIMLIPLPIVWNLHKRRSRKLMLTGIFFCAYCVIVISIARLVVYVQSAHTFPADYTWNTVPYFRWIGCEGPVSIVSICVPNIFHLFKRARRHGMSSMFTRREYHPKPQDRLNKSPNSPPTQDEELLRIDKDSTVSSKTGSVYGVSAFAQNGSEEGSMIAMVDRVHVRQDYDVTEEERWASV